MYQVIALLIVYATICISSYCKPSQSDLAQSTFVITNCVIILMILSKWEDLANHSLLYIVRGF